MADENNNSEEEVAKETTLQDMVEQLSESNILQKSLQESSLKTTEVLTNIAKILQSQLDLSEQEKLDDGRQLPRSEEDDDGGGFKFDKLEMPTSVADGLGLALGAIVGSIGGFFSELRFLMGKGEIDISRVTKKLKNIFAETKLGKMIQGITDSIKRFFSRIKFAFGFQKVMLEDKILRNTKGIQKGLAATQKAISSVLAAIRNTFTTITAKIKSAADIVGKGLNAIGRGILIVFNFFADPIRDVLKMIPKLGGGGVVGKSIEAIKKFFKMFRAFFSSIGRVLARIAYPITIVMGLFEAVTTAIDDFKNQEGGLLSQFTAGAFGFIKGAISFIITDFLDLIKSAVSWIIEKIFGEDNLVTKFLDSFSFTELFKKGIDIIRDFFLSIPKYFEDAFEMGGGVFGALDIFVDDIIDTVANILGFLGEILGNMGQAVLDKIPEPFRKFLGKVGIGTSDGGDSLDQAGADLTSPSNVSMTDAPTSAAIASVPGGVIRVGGNKGTVTNAAGEKRDLSPEEVTAFLKSSGRSKQKDERLVSERKMHQETIDNNAGDDSHMARRKTNRAKSEILGIDKEIALRDPASAQGKAEKMGTGTIATALNTAPQSPMILRSSANTPSSALLGNEGSAVNQGQALQSGTSNLNDAKSKQNSTPPMVVSSSANNSKTSNSNVSNNYTTSNVSAWDKYDPFANQMPSNAAK